jgi:ribosomal protein S14
MDDGDGSYTLELQAQKIARNATLYRGSAPCPQCGVIMNPVEYMHSLGLCQSCNNDRRERRMKGRLV